MNLYTENLKINYGNKVIIDNLNLNIPIGKITALVGANGCGKSTLLKTMSRLLNPTSGEVYINGKSIQSQCSKDISKILAVLPQNPIAPDKLTVYDLVSYGRFPYQKGFGSLSNKDKEVIFWALEVTGMAEFTDRHLSDLSGGQRQRAWIAMALAQQTSILFLDEPTTFLDMGHQLEVLQLLKKLNEEENTTIVMVVHDLNHASRYADNIIAIKGGNIVKEGAPIEVITEDVRKEVFGVDADILYDPKTNVPLCLPYSVSKVNA